MALGLVTSLVGLPGVARAQSAPAWPDLAGAPPASGDGANDAALIIGVEDYVFVPKVPGAAKNATDWFTYLVDGRKVPIGQVKLLRNADATREGVLGRAAEVAQFVKPGGTVWVVFVGHGAPAADGKEGVLVGVDAQQKAESLYARSVRQSELSAALGGKPTVMVLDACFSGRTGSGQPIAPGLQPLILANAAAGVSTTLLTAGKSDQFAGPLPGLNRPAFSYLVLGALRGWGDANGDGVVTAEEALNYAAKALTILPIGRTQTPELSGGNGAMALARKATEKGPNLTGLVSSASGPSFGEGLGRVVEVPTLPEFRGAEAAGGLADLDPDLLALVQTAKRTDAGGSPPTAKAEAWSAVARYPGKNGFRDQAIERRDQWLKVAAAEAARKEQIERVWVQYQKDRAKLDKLKALDATVLSSVQKAALDREFEQVYAPWKADLQQRTEAQDAPARAAAAKAAADKAEHDRHEAAAQEEARSRARTPRIVGGTLLGIGLASAAGTGLLVWAGASTKSNISAGGYATGADIGSAATRVNICNGAAVATGLVGGALTISGIVMLAKSGLKGPDVAVAPTPGGVVVRGSF